MASGSLRGGGVGSALPLLEACPPLELVERGMFKMQQLVVCHTPYGTQEAAEDKSTARAAGRGWPFSHTGGGIRV